MSNSRTSRGPLTRSETRRLEDWIEAHKQQILARDLPSEEAAELATKELGFPVTRAQCFSAAEVLDFKFPRGTPAPEAVERRSQERMTLLKENTKALRDCTAALTLLIELLTSKGQSPNGNTPSR